jgi:hypothetical protein
MNVTTGDVCRILELNLSNVFVVTPAYCLLSNLKVITVKMKKMTKK